MKSQCTLCKTEDLFGEDIVHLQLYVNGSEGINVCLQCRMALTEVARSIQSATARVELRKKMEEQKLKTWDDIKKRCTQSKNLNLKETKK